jgi:hypothetical protein
MRPNIDDQRIDEPFTRRGVSDGRPARPAPAEMAGVPEPGGRGFQEALKISA